MDTSQVDLSDRSLYRSGFPHALFAGLREEAPIFLHESTPGVEAQVGHPFWVTTRMEPARWMSKDLETFSSVAGPSVQRFPAERQGTSLISADGFVHARLRRLVNRGFTPRMVGRLQDQIQGWADRIVEGVADRGQCEFVSEVAYPLPMHLIADIVGIPESD
ncbi:MAG: cytochrome P450 family protein, partial [bacterium]